MTTLPKRNAQELAWALRERAERLTGSGWELAATKAMMIEAADLLASQPEGWQPMELERIEQAARLLREWAGERRRASGKWTAREQAGVDCAIALELIARDLPLPPAPTDAPGQQKDEWRYEGNPRTAGGAEE